MTMRFKKSEIENIIKEAVVEALAEQDFFYVSKYDNITEEARGSLSGALERIYSDLEKLKNSNPKEAKKQLASIMGKIHRDRNKLYDMAPEPSPDDPIAR